MPTGAPADRSSSGSPRSFRRASQASSTDTSARLGLWKTTGSGLGSGQRVLDSTEQLAGSEKAGALEHLADSFVGHASSAAEGYYRRLLHEYPSYNGTTHTQHIKLGELLLDRGSPSDLRAAAALLTEWAPETHLPFPDAHYRWQLAAIRLAEATGDRAAAREAARRALDLAARGPVFSRHKTLGVVNTDAKTIRRLRRLAR